MLYSQKLCTAINHVAVLHRDQVRTGRDRVPYVSHLYSVMHILSRVTDDEDVLVAALYHDSLEDVPSFTESMLREMWGDRVTNFVLGVTEPLDANKSEYEQLPWLTRKEVYLESLAKAPNESALISCADKIHNLLSTEEAIKNKDIMLVERVYSHFKNQRLFYERVHELCSQKLGDTHVLVQELRKHIDIVVKSFDVAFAAL